MKLLTFNEIIELAKNRDKQATLTLIEQFQPLIKKYENRLNYEDAKADLTEKFIQTINKMPDIDNEYCILSYISKAMYFNFVYLSKRNEKIQKYEVKLDNKFLDDKNIKNFNWEHILYDEALGFFPKLVEINGIFDIMI